MNEYTNSVVIVAVAVVVASLRIVALRIYSSIRPMVTQTIFMNYPTDASWDGLDRDHMTDPELVAFLCRRWGQFG